MNGSDKPGSAARREIEGAGETVGNVSAATADRLLGGENVLEAERNRNGQRQRSLGGKIALGFELVVNDLRSAQGEFVLRRSAELRQDSDWQHRRENRPSLHRQRDCERPPT